VYRSLDADLHNAAVELLLIPNSVTDPCNIQGGSGLKLSRTQDISLPLGGLW
jgi:hypothetical protein